MPAIQMKDVSVGYKGSQDHALKGVTLEVQEGEIVLLLGRNNSGKSTFCRLLNGLIPHSIPSALIGSVEVFGRDTRESSVAALSTEVGMVFQEPESQLFCMSVEEEVAFGPENLAVNREEISSRVEWALRTVGLEGLNNRQPSSLSGGQKQRLAIAAALSMRPRMLVLDEPTYALDPIGRIELFSLLADLRKNHGMTVIVVERDAEEAAICADRIVLMDDGEIAGVGTPEKMLANPDTLNAVGVAPLQLSELRKSLRLRTRDDEFLGFTVDEASREIAKMLTKKSADRMVSR